MAEQHKESGRRLRVRERRRYTEEYADEEELLFGGGRAFDVDEKLTSDSFSPEKFNFLREMTGEELNVSFIQQNGFEKPIIVKQMRGLGMKIPDQSFSVSKVKECVGSRRVLDVMDVQTQRDFTMTMKEWTNYYEDPDRKRLLNVISLEFSHTKLEQFVDSPNIVKQVDWIDWVWPKHLKQSQTEGTNSIEDMKYPKVQKYCLMSVKGCYTDFHIDFGGTSVWYHILKGKKVFWLIPPTERNIQLYEQWVLSGKQSDIFFGDTVEQCARISLEAGNTFFIPTGWIHAVYTPEDSLVFGGNFLHSFSIEKQLRVAQVEDVTKVPVKFRYPFYTEVLWYVLARYVYCLMNRNHLKCNEDGVTIVKDNETNENKPMLSPSAPTFKSSVNLTPFELSGLKAIIMWLQRLPPNKRSLPDLIVSAEALLNDAQILIDEHNTDNHQKAVTGHPVLFWKKKVNTGQSLTSQLRQIKHPSFAHKSHVRAKETTVVPPVRPESPPTRPISSNQYTISSGSTINPDLIPSSFAGLIAQTGVNHFQPFTPISNTPILGSMVTPTAQHMISPVGYSMSSSLPPPPPLISTTNPNINQMSNSCQTTNSTQTTYTSFQQKEFSSEAMANQYNHNSNTNSMDKKIINDMNHNFGQNFITTATQSQSFNNFLVNNNIKRNSPPLSVNEMPAQAIRSYPTALPPSGFHSPGIQSEPFVNKMVNSSTQSSFPITNNQKITVSTCAGTTTNTTPTKANSNDSSRRRRTRCKKCDSCLRADCGECHFCKDMKKFGGPGRMKQSCIARQCLAPVLPHTACCMICGRDGWEKLVDPSINDETASSLMECSQCWEIVHPFCLNYKFPQFVATDANINEDLPNSWECPRCVKTGSKNNNKYQKLKSTPFMINNCLMKKEDNISESVESEPPEKRFRMSGDDSPPTSDDEEDNGKQNQKISNNYNNNSNHSIEMVNKDNETEDTDASNSSGQTEGHNSSPSFLSKPYSFVGHSSASAHVRSCARFPLLTQGLKQMANPSNSFANIANKNSSFSSINNNNNNNNKSEVKGLAALMTTKKKNVTARDRLFKSLKGLKKSSEMSVRFGSNSSIKKSNKSNGCSTTTTNSNSSNTNRSSSCSSSSCSSSSSSYNQNSQSLSPCPSASMSSSATTTTQNSFNLNGQKTVHKSEEIKREIHDESTDDEDIIDEVVPKVEQPVCQIKQPNDSPFTPVVDQIQPQREIIKPKYVVRPAPLGCDVSESEESDETEEESDDGSNDTNNNRLKKERLKAKQKYLKKFRKKFNDNLCLERDIMVPVLEQLSKNDLLSSMRVCKKWNAFSMEPKLWRVLDLSNKRINSYVLIGVVRRQPWHLNLSWTNINRRQLFWLICRLPQLESLSLVGCPASVVSALATCNCPRLALLDISWSESLNDDIMQDLLSAPIDSRPGFLETKTRLRFLSDLRLSGSNISDKTIRLITQNLPFVKSLDLSNCNKITDMGIGVLATARSKDLISLKLSACSNVSDMSFIHLKKCPNILHLDLRECTQVTRTACHQFMSQYPPQTKLICNN